ncbi:MAG: radical SAM protein [Oscillospiraceae bacterium]|nr:radical SAM protein [Oscillospiraceae bacterium]
MEEKMKLQNYLTAGVENIVKNTMQVTWKNPAQSLFMAKFALASKAASKTRERLEREGEHIPAFLIASITSSCNLHCAGCYARAVHTCEDGEPMKQLSAEEWDSIFAQAESLGISFVFLVGGEPLMRRDVIQRAGERQKILFPIFTNGTLLDSAYRELFKKSRNLIPIFSIEGRKAQTDNRRGKGIYETVFTAMEHLQKEKLLFGCSVTVTKENLQEVTSDAFLHHLKDSGCMALFYIEFAPTTPSLQKLAPTDKERRDLEQRLTVIRKDYPEMLFLSFPGDEKSSGGCIAAGRGFFHINSHGGAEPCPFSPYSDSNVRDTSLREALHSELFEKLQNSGALLDDHVGGCVLLQKQQEVRAYLQNRST